MVCTWNWFWKYILILWNGWLLYIRQPWAIWKDSCRSFLRFDFVSVHKNAQKNRSSANTKPYWPQTWSITYLCCLKELSGNTDGTTVVSHDLNPPILARYIRFRPLAWHRVIAMRVELYGCQGMWESLKAAIFCNFFLNFLMETVMLVYIMWQARDKLT